MLNGGAQNLNSMQPVFGNAARKELFAERDTGYGVCGVMLNVPLNGGYASIRSVIPTMPAAEPASVLAML